MREGISEHSPPLIQLDTVSIKVIFFSVYHWFKPRWNPTILAVAAVASAFASGAVSHAHTQNQSTASSAAQAASGSPSVVQILSPTDGVDFNPYILKLVSDVKLKWYASMPEAALKGEKGTATVRFGINANGEANDLLLETSSGKNVFDQAAMQSIRDSSPFHPLPVDFKRPSITLRFVFYYNEKPPTATTDAAAADCDAGPSPTPPDAPFDRLELLGFVSHNFDVKYAEKIICRRGIDFTPDAATLDSFRIYNVPPALVATIGKIKPKTIDTPPPDRDRAYKSLTLALSDIREGQPKAADVDYKRALQLTEDSATLHSSYAGYLLRRSSIRMPKHKRAGHWRSGETMRKRTWYSL